MRSTAATTKNTNPPPKSKEGVGGVVVNALPELDVLKRLLNDGLVAGGGDQLTSEERGAAVADLEAVYLILDVVPNARKFLGLVLSGKPLTMEDGVLIEA